MASLEKEKKILIHAASGAVGQACVVLAQHVRTEIFVTAGSPVKREFLHNTFNIPQDHIFCSRTPESKDGILSVTDNKGIDVIANSLSGNPLQETWAVISEFERFVELGKRGLLQNSYLTMRPFDRNVTFSGVDLRTLFLNRPEEHRACLSDLTGLIKSGVIVPIQPLTAVPISQIAKGLRKLQSGQNIGKIVITMDPDERIIAEGPSPLQIPTGNLLRADATYIITGGTAGIGLSLVPWMVEHGAHNLLLLGRSGSSRPDFQKVLQQYENTGVHVRAVACDVGRREDLVHALHCIQDLLPVRGVIHGALFLKVCSFAECTRFDLTDYPLRTSYWRTPRTRIGRILQSLETRAHGICMSYCQTTLNFSLLFLRSFQAVATSGSQSTRLLR